VTEKFFIRSKGRVEGPFSADKLRELAGRGRFARHYEVSPDGKTWSSAGSYPGLFPVPTQRKIRSSTTLPPVERGTTVIQKIPEMGGEVASTYASTSPLASASPETQWHYAHHDESRGPVPFSELERLALVGELGPEDLIWTDGMPDWLPAASAAPNLFGSESGSGQWASTGRALQNCPMAIASLTFGLLGMNLLLFVGSIAAIVCGHIALKQIEQNPNTLTGRGLAIFGLVLGYFAVAAGIVTAVIIIAIKIVQHKDAGA
jgi:hypothetical protein